MPELHRIESKHDSRRFVWKRLFYGLPSVIVATCVIFAVLFGRKASESTLSARYSKAASSAVNEEQFSTAELYYRKLVLLEPGNRRFQYALALTVADFGKHRRAWVLMSHIAPDDRTGYGPAHFWLASQLYQLARARGLNAESFDLLEHHLLGTIKHNDRHAPAQMMLGQLYLTMSQVQSDARLLGKSVRHLARGVDSFPQFRHRLAKLYALLGENESARRQAELAIAYYTEQVALEPQDTDARLMLAANQIFLKLYAAAELTMQQGLAETENEQLQTALVGLYVSWFDHTEPSQLRMRLELLQRALTYVPDAPVVLERLALFADQKGTHAEQAMAILQKALDRGDAPATVHVMLGSQYTNAADHEKAIFHLDQAIDANLNTPEVMNNLAWALAHAEPPQFERALDLINTALQATPDDPTMRDTRGVIYLKLNRYQDAITDLEFALKAERHGIGLHENLAKAYEETGQTEQAAEQQRMIEQLKKGQQSEAVTHPKD